MTADPSGSRAASLTALPLAFIALAAAAWLVLVEWQPTTTWHLAPALIGGAGAWVTASDQSGDPATRRRRIAALAVVGLAVAVGEVALLHAIARLEGPTLLGMNVVVESIAMAAAGAASAVLASLRSGQSGASGAKR